LAFPCNQFGGQEPGSPSDIRKFVDGYGVTFPVFEKIEVNGAGEHPIYRFLKGKATTPALFGDIKWNFAKFLVGRDGKVVKRYMPQTSPSSIESDILLELQKPAPPDEL